MADPKRVSFHIGLNRYDSDAYLGAAKLLSPRVDAQAMYDLARAWGYTLLDLKPAAEWDGSDPAPANVRLDEKATFEEVTILFDKAAAMLAAGDRCFITFSCHGVQVADTASSAVDGGNDESICLFDCVMTDDVLTGLLLKFEEKVNVILVLDCCHAGASTDTGVLKSLKTVLGQWVSFANKDLATKERPAFGKAKAARKPVKTPPALAVYLEEKFKNAKQEAMRANVAVFQACHDFEITYDGKNKGDLSVYTRKFVDAAADGDKSIAAVRDAIKDAEPKIAGTNPDFRPKTDEPFLTTTLKSP